MSVNGVKILSYSNIKRVGDGSVSLCGRCNGNGKVWKGIGFGDLPSDDELIDCTACNGTGRVKQVKMTVDAVVPFDFEE